MVLLGRPYAHPVDVYVRNISLVALFILGGVLIYDASKEPTDNEKSSATCWVPAYFTTHHNVYTQEACKITDIKWTRNYEEFNGTRKPKFTKIKFDLTDKPRSQLPNMVAFMGDFRMDKVACQVMTWIVTQAAVTGVIFLLLRNIAGRAYGQSHMLLTAPKQQAMKTLLTSRCTAISYLLVQVAHFLAMVIIFAKLHNLWPEKPTGAEGVSSNVTSKVFLCDFEVRQLGNVHRHTVQCIGRQVAGALPNTSAIPHLILYLHTALAGIIALMNLFHIIQVHVLTPAASHIMRSYGNLKLRSFSEKLLFGLSDLNLALLFMNSMGHTHTTINMSGSGNENDVLHNPDFQEHVEDENKKGMGIV